MNEDTCRICLDTGELLTPCKCAGTLAFVHEACQLYWHAKLGKLRHPCETCRTTIVVVEPLAHQAGIEWHNYATYARHLARCVAEWVYDLPYRGFSLRDVAANGAVLGCGLALAALVFGVAGASAYVFGEVIRSIVLETGLDYPRGAEFLAGLRLLLVSVPASVVLYIIWDTQPHQRQHQRQQPPCHDPSLVFAEISVCVSSPKAKPLARFVLRAHVFSWLGSVLVWLCLWLWRHAIAGTGFEAVLTCWKPRGIRDVPTDYMFVLAAVYAVAALKPGWHAIRRSFAVMAAGVLVLYVHAVALLFAATGTLALQPNTFQFWALWLVGAALWYDWRISRAQVAIMIRRTTYGDTYGENAPRAMYLVPLLSYSLLVWTISKVPTSGLNAHWLWAALLVAAVITLLGPSQHRLALVAGIWLKEGVWMRLVAWLPHTVKSESWVVELVLVARAWTLMAVLGVVPLLIGRAAVAVLDVKTNDLLVWASALALELPLLGRLLLELSPRELRYTSRFQKLDREWTGSVSTLKNMRGSAWPSEWYMSLPFLVDPLDGLQLAIMVLVFEKWHLVAD